MELHQPASNADHAEIRLTASTPPVNNEELRDICHLLEPTNLHLFWLPHSDQEIKSESNLYYCGQSWHLDCTFLSRRERERIHDGCREWRCSGKAQSPSTSTMPSRNNPIPSLISEGTMPQEVSIILQKTQEDGVPTKPNPPKKIRGNQPTAGRGSMLSLHNPDPTGAPEICMLAIQGLISP